MPGVYTFTVVRTQEVKVSAETPADAVRVGNAAFDNEDHTMQEIGGHVTREVQTLSIEASKDF